jgi:hypothetical protein
LRSGSSSDELDHSRPELGIGTFEKTVPRIEPGHILAPRMNRSTLPTTSKEHPLRARPSVDT